MKKLTPFEVIAVINDKTDKIDVESVGYEPFVINRCFSNIPETVFYANELNRYPRIPKQWQFDFYYHGLDKKKRFGKWHKSEADKEAIELIKEYLGCSERKAKDYIDILKPHFDEIKKELEKGGMTK